MASDRSSTGREADDLVEAAVELVGTRRVWSGQLLYSSVRLGIIDTLDDEPTPADEIARELELQPDCCYRLLRALGHFGVLVEDERRRFALAPVGELFRADHPRSVRNLLLLDRSQEWMRPLFHLEDVVREGPPEGFVREFGTTFFEYTEANPEFGDVFNGHMSDRSRRETRLVLDALEGHDFSGVSRVCDVGGGHGHLVCSFLREHPDVEGTVLDLPGVLAEEDRRWAPRMGVEDRCSYEAGDMFDAVPSADAYFLKFILHDWSDAECVRILSNLHDAAPAHGRLFVVEMVVPGPETPHFAKRLDMTMMVHLGGRERTKAEHRDLLERSGWSLEETMVPEAGELSVLEARCV